MNTSTEAYTFFLLLLLLLLLLYYWILDRAVLPNYDVVMLQSRPGTASILSSVAIVTSYLKTLSHHLIFFWIRLPHPLYPDSPSHTPA